MTPGGEFLEITVAVLDLREEWKKGNSPTVGTLLATGLVVVTGIKRAAPKGADFIVTTKGLAVSS